MTGIMKQTLASACAVFLVFTSCNMENPLLVESALPYGAPQFDKIRNEHYLPAFREAVSQAKAEIDAIVDNPEDPDFFNTIEALEYSGRALDRVSGIFYNLNEADTDEEMQSIAEEVSPLMTEYSMYVSLNERLFERVKAVYERRSAMALDPDQEKLLEETYRSFVRRGANLSGEDKTLYSKYSEELSLLSLQFQKNSLAATNAFFINVTDPAELAGLPQYMKDMGKEYAKERGLEGWVFTLDYPCYAPFMKFCVSRDLRKRMYMGRSMISVGGEFDNTETVRKIVDLRMKIASLLGYGTYADYVLEENMARTKDAVEEFLGRLLEPSLPYARKEVNEVYQYAVRHGFGGEELMPWDFTFWAERYKEAEFAFNEEQLKPYFRLDNCIDAVFGLAGKLYGVTFEERPDIPGYHKDVKVYDVRDADGTHLALFYADFFPRESKRSGAWMTEFRGQSIYNGVEERPFVSIVTNFTKPIGDAPSLITHDEFTTFLHEFGHALHGMFAKGRYGSLTGTNVSRDFVELPSQIMENWAYEPEYLDSFAKDYRSGEVIPAELIDKVVAAKNYLSGYYQVRQLQFGIIDMAWHTLTELPEEGTVEFEKESIGKCAVLPEVQGTAISPSFGHIFSGGYAAGYYSYKWAEVLEADAFSLFKEKGIFSREVAGSFRHNILEKGGSVDPDILYRNFRGHDPQPEALLEKLGLTGE